MLIVDPRAISFRGRGFGQYALATRGYALLAFAVTKCYLTAAVSASSLAVELSSPDPYKAEICESILHSTVDALEVTASVFSDEPMSADVQAYDVV